MNTLKNVNIILNMSMSLNGLVARENDSTNFLTHGEWPLFVELAQQTGALMWGRRTHEIVRSYGGQVLAGFDGLTRVVVSRNLHLSLEPGWQSAASPQQALDLLASAGKSQVLLGGGASLNTAFACDGLIDEIVLFVDSVIVGNGIPLFAPETFDLPLSLIEVSQVRDEVVRLQYRVNRQ